MVKEFITLMKYSTNLTLLLGSYMAIDYVFSISSSIPSEQGDLSFTSSMLSFNSRMVSLIRVIFFSLTFFLIHPFRSRLKLIQKAFNYVQWMKDPPQLFYLPRLGRIWVLQSLCQLPLSILLSIEDIFNIWGLFLSFVSC
jgi:hypothetical protein